MHSRYLESRKCANFLYIYPLFDSLCLFALDCFFARHVAAISASGRNSKFGLLAHKDIQQYESSTVMRVATC